MQGGTCPPSHTSSLPRSTYSTRPSPLRPPSPLPEEYPARPNRHATKGPSLRPDTRMLQTRHVPSRSRPHGRSLHPSCPTTGRPHGATLISLHHSPTTAATARSPQGPPCWPMPLHQPLRQLGLPTAPEPTNHMNTRHCMQSNRASVGGARRTSQAPKAQNGSPSPLDPSHVSPPLCLTISANLPLRLPQHRTRHGCTARACAQRGGEPPRQVTCTAQTAMPRRRACESAMLIPGPTGVSLNHSHPCVPHRLTQPSATQSGPQR